MDEKEALLGHLPGEATPQEVAVSESSSAPSPFGLHDAKWTDEEWLALLNLLVGDGFVSWKEVTALVLGQLNPPQSGTSLASSEGFRKRYGKGNTMKIVMEWAHKQTGKCEDCGTRLDLQADHIKSRESYTDPLDADFIENMTLRCRRCNVVRRPSHEFGGITFLTAEAALMWILLVIKPRTFKDYVRLCRLYGMTMADIRMVEAWAMAHWLSRNEPPAYGIEDDKNSLYDLIQWSDSAITRVDPDSAIPAEATHLYTNISGEAILGFLTLQEDGRIKFHEQSIACIPFSTYDLGELPPQSLAIHYVPPDRENKKPPMIIGLAPRGLQLISHAIRSEHQHFALTFSDSSGTALAVLPKAPVQGRIVKTKIPSSKAQLTAVDSSPATPALFELSDH